MNDDEAAFILGCPGDFGILVTVGTGVNCMSRIQKGKQSEWQERDMIMAIWVADIG